MNLSRILRPNRVWSIGVYVERSSFTFTDRLGSPEFVLNAKTRRQRQRHIHTYADPFLFTHENELYFFYELQRVGENGLIAAYKTRDLRTFTDLGEILTEHHHLSYPFVFRDGQDVYLLPESAAAGEVALYKFKNFPYEPVKLRILLSGTFFDSSFIKVDGIWYLFTTCDRGLEIYYTDDLLEGDLIPHPIGIVATSPETSRCGGGPILVDGKMYRIAQNSAGGYGKNIIIMQINELTRTAYNEETVIENYFRCDQSWNSRGGHHLSLVDFNGERIIAVDGLQNDMFINKALALLDGF